MKCGKHCSYVSDVRNLGGLANHLEALKRYYQINTAAIPPVLHSAYRPLNHDEETATFVASCIAPRNSCEGLLNYGKDLAAAVLRKYMSVTDANGLLDRGHMFVLSRQQASELLHPARMELAAGIGATGSLASSSAQSIAVDLSDRGNLLPGSEAEGLPKLGSLLDVGAGDGSVTSHLQSYFSHVCATEVSEPMTRRLRSRGYEVVQTACLTGETFPGKQFDVVSIFNVLDRCDHPADLLRGAIRLMRPDTGRLLLAVVLPFSEFVEEGAARRSVVQPLPMRGARCGDSASFEVSLAALCTRVLMPLGLQLERLAKVPYLCRGDSNQPYYILSDAILVCKLSDQAMRAPHSFANVWRYGSALSGQQTASGAEF